MYSLQNSCDDIGIVEDNKYIEVVYIEDSDLNTIA